MFFAVFATLWFSPIFCPLSNIADIQLPAVKRSRNKKRKTGNDVYLTVSIQIHLCQGKNLSKGIDPPAVKMMFGSGFRAISTNSMVPSSNIDLKSIVCTEIQTTDGPYIVICSHGKDHQFRVLSVRKSRPTSTPTLPIIDLARFLLIETDLASFAEPTNLVATRFPRGGPLYPPFRICSNCKPIGSPRDELDSHTRILTHSHFATLGLNPNASQHEIADQWNIYAFLFSPELQWPWYAESADLALDQVYEAGNELYDLKKRSKYTAKIILNLIQFQEPDDPAHDMIKKYETRLLTMNKLSEEARQARLDDIDNEEASQNGWLEDPMQAVLQSSQDQDLCDFEEFLSTSVYLSYKTDNCGNPKCYRPYDPTFSSSSDELAQRNHETDIFAKVTVVKPYKTFCATFPRYLTTRKGVVTSPRVCQVKRPQLTSKEKCGLVFVRRRTQRVIRDHPNIPPAKLLPKLAGGLRRLTQVMRKQTALHVRYLRKPKNIFMKWR